MPDQPNGRLPLGAEALELEDVQPSEELIRWLAESGASDEALDAVGGKGTAARVRAGLAAA